MSTKKERLLDWIKNGDPSQVPVVMASGYELAASLLDKKRSDVSISDISKVTNDSGMHAMICVGQPMPFDAIDFIDDISLNMDEEVLADGTKRWTKCITTPKGSMQSIEELPLVMPHRWTEHYVKGQDDLPVLEYLIRQTAAAFKNNDKLRAFVVAQMKNIQDEVAGEFPTFMHMVPAYEDLGGPYFMDTITGIYMFNDNHDLIDELMNLHLDMEKVWMECANEFAMASGKKSWIHTCGQMQKIAHAGMYEKMKVDIVESLSSLPTGDIGDLAETRRDIGDRIVTRGGINVELFYGDDIDALTQQANHVIDSMQGFKHMIGDTNSSTPPYPGKNIPAFNFIFSVG